ncbi:MAG: hypothetical protein LCH58_06105 [Bacteroidetes bacterium]|jgi:hypothetical protein|uniref:hypothetical protein n=1 Tax=Phnomibacter sp. TaxID=2836217 RepID=UPI002FDD0133|nr:hypothetical protein [Bacteroidota bacterium]
MALIQFNKNITIQGGGGEAASSTTIYVGWVKHLNAVTVAQLQPVKVITGAQQYQALAAAVANLAGNESELLNLVIVEPTTEPVKNSALLYRISGSSFIRSQIEFGGLFTMQVVGGNRIYRSQAIEAYLADGNQIGPVVLSTNHALPVTFTEVDPIGNVYAYRVRIGEPPCGAEEITVYSDSVEFATGITLFSDPFLETPAMPPGTSAVAPFPTEGINAGLINTHGEIFILNGNEVGLTTSGFCA